MQQALVTSVYREIKGLQESGVKNVLPGRGRDEGVSPGFLRQRRRRISCTGLSTKSLSCRASLIPRGAFSRGWRGRFGSGTGAAGGLHERRRASFLPAPPSTLPARQGRQGRQGSGEVPAQGLAACSPACAAALQERREMRAPCLRRGHLMLAAPEIAWKAFVLVIFLLSLRMVGLGWGWRGERVLQSSVRLRAPKSWPKPEDHPPISSATRPPASPSPESPLHEAQPGFSLATSTKHPPRPCPWGPATHQPTGTRGLWVRGGCSSTARLGTPTCMAANPRHLGLSPPPQRPNPPSKGFCIFPFPPGASPASCYLPVKGM